MPNALSNILKEAEIERLMADTLMERLTAAGEPGPENPVGKTGFHIDPAATFKTVPLTRIEELAGSRIEIDRDLELAASSNPPQQVGFSRQSLSVTPPSSYPVTRT